jgi:4-coumarate--CoA ligase
MFSYDKKTKILSGIQLPPFYHPNVTVGQVIANNLQREPERVVQVSYDDGVELTAAEMLKLASRIAKNLVKEGFKLGDVVGIVVKNTTYVAPVFLACLLVGCPISTLDPIFEVTEIVS